MIQGASAYFRMDLTSSKENLIAANGSSVGITLKNGGDEPAYDTKIELKLPAGMAAETLVAGTVDGNSAYTGKFNVAVADGMMPGSYSTPVYLYVKDANGYQYNMVYPLTLTVGREAVPKLTMKASVVDFNLDEEKPMELMIRNLDDVDHEVTLKDEFPELLLVKDLPRTVKVPAKGTQVVSPKVSSFGALPDSSYTVLFSAGYVQDGVHFETLTIGRVNTLKADWKAAAMSNQYLLAAAVLIALAAAYLVLRRLMASSGGAQKARKKGRR
jgi:hypothetical protein